MSHRTSPHARSRALVALLVLAAALALAPRTAPRAGAAAPPPVLTLVPDAGPCNEHNRVVARGAGFRPGQELRLHAVRSAPVRGDNIVEVGRATVGADGILALPLPWIGCDPADPPGTQYTIFVAGMEPPPGDVFTVGALGERCFAETDFCVKERFLDYWRAHGLDLGDEGVSERESLALFGYPLSGEFVQTLEDGKEYTVQYFERARLEYHPENPAPHDVLLGQFGRRILAGVAGAPTAPVPPAAQPGTIHFPETGHNVPPPFSTFWRRNGGLAVFGYPLSAPFTQTLEDGKQYRVQYFERARLEEHPAGEGTPYNIQLGQFGRRILAGYEGEPLYQVGTYVSDDTPPQGGDLAVSVDVGKHYQPLPRYRIETIWHFPTGPRTCEAQAIAPGHASCTLTIGSPPAGIAITIDATAILPDGTRLATQTRFTPRRP